MSISTNSPQVVEATKTEEATEILPNHTELSYQPLAILYEQLLADLDRLFRTVAASSSAALKDNSTTEARDIDEFVYRFQLWANDIASRTPTKVGSTAEVLQALDDTQCLVAFQLRDLFQRMLRCTRLATVAVSDNQNGTFKDQVQLLRGQSEEIRGLTHPIRRVYRDIDELKPEHTPGSVVLCLDGGGIKSYSSLLILKALMEEVCSIQGSKTLRPRDYFDYVFGSSSGGLIAIMLGRLKMDIDECIKSFETYANDIFGHPRFFTVLRFGITNRQKYSNRNVEKAVRKVAKDYGKVQDGRTWKINTFAAPHDHCRTGVVASTTDNVKAATPYIFRTYDVFPTGSSFHLQRNPGPAESLPIWMVGRATAAAPFYFGPLVTDGRKFMDGGFSFANNPSVEAYREVDGIYRQHVQKAKSDSVAGAVSLFISIGSGIDASIKPRFPSCFEYYFSITRMLASKATDTESSVSEMRDIADVRDFPYFRFNVDRGVGELPLDEWKRPKRGSDLSSSETLQRIKSATHQYLKKEDTQAELEKCARRLVSLRRLRL